MLHQSRDYWSRDHPGLRTADAPARNRMIIIAMRPTRHPPRCRVCNISTARKTMRIGERSCEVNGHVGRAWSRCCCLTTLTKEPVLEAAAGQCRGDKGEREVLRERIIFLPLWRQLLLKGTGEPRELYN